MCKLLPWYFHDTVYSCYKDSRYNADSDIRRVLYGSHFSGVFICVFRQAALSAPAPRPWFPHRCELTASFSPCELVTPRWLLQQPQRPGPGHHGNQRGLAQLLVSRTSFLSLKSLLKLCTGMRFLGIYTCIFQVQNKYQNKS